MNKGVQFGKYTNNFSIKNHHFRFLPTGVICSISRTTMMNLLLCSVLLLKSQVNIWSILLLTNEMSGPSWELINPHGELKQKFSIILTNLKI